MKFAEPRIYADPEKAARRIVEIASTVEPVQDGRIHVELINGPFPFKDKGSPAEYGAGMKLALGAAGWRCTKAVPSCGSHRLGPSCSREGAERKRPRTESQTKMNQKGRSYRLVVQVSKDDQRAIDDFWFRERLPSRAAAVRELLRRGLSRASDESSN